MKTFVHSFSLSLLYACTVSIFSQTHPLLQIFETLLVQNFYKLRLKILVTIPRPTSHWAVRLQVVQHVHFLLWGLSIKANKMNQQRFCEKITKFVKIFDTVDHITWQIPTEEIPSKSKADHKVYTCPNEQATWLDSSYQWTVHINGHNIVYHR